MLDVGSGWAVLDWTPKRRVLAESEMCAVDVVIADELGEQAT
jgi:hypothetical protein